MEAVDVEGLIWSVAGTPQQVRTNNL
jgi:hypothetical protein